MTAGLLAGKPLAQTIQHDIQAENATRLHDGAMKPGLAVVLVGQDTASAIYVQHKHQACLAVGFHSEIFHLPTETSQNALFKLIDQLNHQKTIHGILVQLPLPAHIHTPSVLERVDPQKDIDGFHPYNMGRLAQGQPQFRPCTPYGIMTLLEYHQIALKGCHAVVVGASNIVGRPMALELLRAKATVTVCHSATRHLEQHVRLADVLIVATGQPGLIKSDWLHAQQIVVDVGIHRDTTGKIHGDIPFAEALHQVAWITPVPGGVGPMTIAMLLRNTLDAAKQRDQRSI